VLLLEVDESGSIARAVELLPLLNAPAQIRFLLEGLSARISGQEGPGNQLAVEVLYTARAAVRLNIYEGDDPIVAFGQESARHDGRVLKALAAVLKRGARPTPVGQAPLVVLAERDINLLTGLESRLTEAGFRVMTVGDGDQVLAQVRTRPVAAVISGIRLPTKDGIAMLMELKRDDRFSRLPVLLLGEGGAADVSRGLDLGADDVVQRPIHPEAVLARLRKVLDQRRSNKSAGINGTISGLPLVDLIQILMMGGRTAWIRVATSNEEGSLQLRSGQLTAATIGTDWTGEEALYALVDLDEGHFEVFFEDRGQSNLNGSSEFLLLEAVRRRDERRGS
jgi:DNA-binding response OmpR family regulator